MSKRMVVIKAADSPKPCPKCAGTGSVRKLEEGTTERTICPACNGWGIAKEKEVK